MAKKLIQKTLKGTFIIRPYESDDDDQIISSWQKAFNKQIDISIWRWKYKYNPSGFRTMLCLAENGEVAVHYAAQAYKVNYRNHTKLALHSTDNFSHPDYRWALGGKTGLFVKTAWAFLRTYLNYPLDNSFDMESPLPTAHFHYGFPGERHYRLGERLMFYRSFKPAVLYLTCNPDEHADYLHKKRWVALLHGCILTDTATNLPDVNALWHDLVQTVKPFMVIRDHQFLTWRYFHKSISRYGYNLFCMRNRISRKIEAWIVFRKNTELNTFTIVDFLAKDTCSLTNLLISFIKDVATGTVNCWCSENHFLARSFLDAGFITQPNQLGIVPCTTLQKKAAMSATSEHFMWTIGDSDLF